MTCKNIETLIELIDTLRGENGCPWDQRQTPRTMALYLLEEAYELLDAIESGTPDEVCEELGDVFFHIPFIAKLFQEEGHFDMEDIAGTITKKMVRRHPHIFGDATLGTEKEVRRQWAEIKKKEKNHAPLESVLDSVSASQPALMRAYRISERAAGTGFEWDDISGVMEKVEEEWAELKYELADSSGDNQEKVALEFGDVLFTMVNVARFAKIHPETALADSVRKFEKRFKYMEKMFSKNGKNIDAASPEEMNRMWEEAKGVCS